MIQPARFTEQVAGKLRTCTQNPRRNMDATILLGTLKRTGLSNTETLSEFLVERM